MDRTAYNNSDYKSSLSFLSFLTLLFAFGCTMLGYILLPFAAAFYATLLSVENKHGRILSYVIPVFVFVINIFLNGFFSLEGIVYVILGLLIHIGYTRKLGKGMLVFILTASTILFFVLSAFLSVLDSLGSFNLAATGDYLLDKYESVKVGFVELLTSIYNVDEAGQTFCLFNSSDATELFNSIILMLVPMSAVAAFTVTGIALKIYRARIRKIEGDSDEMDEWRFYTPPFLAYSYLVISILSLFVSNGIFGITVSFVSTIFMYVYFYFGISFIYDFLASKKGTSFALVVIIAAFFFFSSFAVTALSYVGIFVNNSLNPEKELTD